MVQPDWSPPLDVTATPQQAARAEPAAPGRLLRLEVVTDGHRIVGVTQRPTVARLVDLLKSNDEPALALADVEMVPLEAQGEAPHRWPQAYVYKQAMAFAIPQEEEPGTVAISRRSLEYVEKRSWPISVLLPRFMVTGEIHLPPAADPANASLFWNSGFVALTNAGAVFLPDPTMTWKAAVIIVNTARVETCCPRLP